MKKLILAVAFLSAGFAMEAKTENVLSGTSCYISDPKWSKCKDGTWMGANNTWYKVNTKDASIWMSKDGKKWDQVKDGMWQDKDGKWLKIVDKDLKWSADGGKTWESVPEWKWQGADGTWYKFDKDWSVWCSK